MAEGPVAEPQQKPRTMSREVRLARKGQHPQFTKPVHQIRAHHLLTGMLLGRAKQLEKDEKNEKNPKNYPYDMYDRIFAVDTCVSFEVSKTSIWDLRRMTLKELRLEEYVKGKYLLLRTIEPPYEHHGIVTVVEDHVGNVVQFRAHHFPKYSNEKNADITDIFPVDTMFLLKEPFCNENEKGECLLHCGCPSDLIVVYDGLELHQLTGKIEWKHDVVFNYQTQPPYVENVKDWVLRGHALCQDGKLECSTRCYFRALGLMREHGDNDGLWRTATMGMIEVMKRRGWTENAFDLCKEVIEKAPGYYDIWKTSALMAYRLKKYKEAKKYAERCLTYNQSVETLKWSSDFVSICDRRIEEKEAGEFDMLELMKFRMDHPVAETSCSDYRGPVELRYMGVKGRGVFAMKNIEPGTLLVVSKAIAYCFNNKDVRLPETEVWQDLINQLVYVLAGCPKMYGEMVYRLYDGENVAEAHPRVFCDEVTKEETIIDIRKLAGIIKNNMFGEGCEFVRIPRTLSRSRMYKSGCGLFAWASYFNHSCLPNASIHETNDLIFIRAIQGIKKGEQIFVPYVSWEMPFAVRQVHCSSLGFRCECKLCEIEEKLSEDVIAKRRELFFEYDIIYERVYGKNMGNWERMIDYIHRMIERFEATYENNKIYPQKIFMSVLYDLLAKAHNSTVARGSWDPYSEIKYHLLSLKYLGFNINNVLKSLNKRSNEPNALLDINVHNTVATMTILYGLTNQHELEKKWRKIVLELEKCYFGGNDAILTLKYQLI